MAGAQADHIDDLVEHDLAAPGVEEVHPGQALGSVADRFQQSGWMIPDVVGADAADVVALLAELLAPEDRLRVYAPCPACTRAARWLPESQSHRLTPDPVWIAK